MPQNLPGQKPLVLVTHDESTFSANDGKPQLWMENIKQPLRPKAWGKGLMVSDFLTPGGRLAVPDAVSDAELAARLLPGRHATEHFVYGKDKYWWGDDKLQFQSSTLHFLAVKLNASNHCSYAADALRVENMNLHLGGKQGMLREASVHGKGLPQSVSFAQDDYNRELAQPRGVK